MNLLHAFPGAKQVDGAQEMLVQVNGHGLYVEASGPPEGRPVVLLHHGLGSVRAWKGQVEALVRAGCRVLAYDRWGFGRSAPRPGLDVPQFEADQADLEALLAQVGMARPALVGHSDGGTIALAYAVRRPGRVAGLVAVAAHVYVEPKMETGIFEVVEAYRQDASFRQGLARVHGEKAAMVFNNWFEGWVRPENRGWDLRPALAGIDCPVLVVQGIEDQHALPDHAREIAAAIPGAALWLEPGADHMLPQLLPGKFNQRLVDFLSDLEWADRAVVRPEQNKAGSG